MQQLTLFAVAQPKKKKTFLQKAKEKLHPNITWDFIDENTVRFLYYKREKFITPAHLTNIVKKLLPVNV